MTSPAPLQGLRVLDFSSMMAGPYCGRWLADLGADVVKVESPDGDYMRSRPPMRDGRSAYFGHLNAGKRSVVLDLKNPSGQSVARRLARTADVLIEGARPGVMRRLGLDYASLAHECPQLIYCSVSGWGQEGPRARQPAYAAIVHAATGFDRAWQAGQPGDADTPPACAVQIADVMAASFAVMGIQSALLARVHTGRGQHVDLSLGESMLCLMPLEVVQAQFGASPDRSSYRATRALDGDFVATPISQKNFEDLCDAIGRGALKRDPRFATSAERVVHWEELLAELASWARERTTDECVSVLERAGVPVSTYNTVRDALNDPQLRARGFLRAAEDGPARYDIAGLPFQLGDAVIAPHPRHVPALGEHTQDVLRDLLSLDAAAIGQLVSEGAFGAPSQTAAA